MCQTLPTCQMVSVTPVTDETFTCHLSDARDVTQLLEKPGDVTFVMRKSVINELQEFKFDTLIIISLFWTLLRPQVRLQRPLHTH